MLNIDDLQRVIIAAEFGDVAAGASTTETVMAPEGFGLLRSLYFNPALNTRISIQSQNQRKNIVDKFSTLVGTATGRLLLNQGVEENDRYSVEIINLETTTKNIVVSFEYIRTK